MKLKTGLLLESTAALEDDYFAGVIIFIVEYNKDGAIGFVVNRPFGKALNALEEFKHSASFPLYEGGPVDNEHLFFLHRRSELIEGGAPVGKGIYYGGNFKQAVNGINNKSLKSSDLKIFVGYCGWEAGELEVELREGSWNIISEESDTIFNLFDQ